MATKIGRNLLFTFMRAILSMKFTPVSSFLSTTVSNLPICSKKLEKNVYNWRKIAKKWPEWPWQRLPYLYFLWSQKLQKKTDSIPGRDAFDELWFFYPGVGNLAASPYLEESKKYERRIALEAVNKPSAVVIISREIEDTVGKRNYHASWLLPLIIPVNYLKFEVSRVLAAWNCSGFFEIDGVWRLPGFKEWLSNNCRVYVRWSKQFKFYKISGEQ